MQTTMFSNSKLLKHHVGELPLIHSITRRFRLREILDKFIPQQHNEDIAPADTLMLLVSNLSIGRAPLYALGEWTKSLDLKKIGYGHCNAEKFQDDRFGRALDKLFTADRASLMTAVILEVIQAFQVDLRQCHNDSTTIKAFGEYSGQSATGFELRHGKSKDHRPDLKQLLFTLTVSADGAVPIHHCIYPGNRTDDTTHIDTWKALLELHKTPNFLYVADSKLCTDPQLNIIVEEFDGRVVTVIPNTWSEVNDFKNELRKSAKKKKEILRVYDEFGNSKHYFSVFEGEYKTKKRGYAIHWIHSSEKSKEDLIHRKERLKKAEKKLQELLLKINKRNLKSKEAIEDAYQQILKHYHVQNFIKVEVKEYAQERSTHSSLGRPCKNTHSRLERKTLYELSWEKDLEALKAEERIDGIFPLLSSDRILSSKEVLIAHKYQPKLEKRFSQLKSVHYAAPLLCKKLERVESMMFIFFLALLVQSLVEREVRKKMQTSEWKSLEVYPENRDTSHPTTNKIFEAFSQVCSYELVVENSVIESYRDDFNALQSAVLTLLDISPEEYWGDSIVNSN